MAQCHNVTPLETGAVCTSAIANGRYCHVTYKLLYSSIRVRTDSAPVSVRVSVRVSVSFSFTV